MVGQPVSFSLRVTVERPSGSSSIFDIVESHTYNLAPMWCRALGIDATRDLQGVSCGELIPKVQLAFLDILNHQEAYRVMEPDNGWGDFAGFWETFGRFALAVHAHPTGKIVWSGL